MKALEPVNCCNSAVAVVGRGHSCVVQVQRQRLDLLGCWRSSSVSSGCKTVYIYIYDGCCVVGRSGDTRGCRGLAR